MNRRHLLAAAALPLAWRAAPDTLSTQAFAATAPKDEKIGAPTQRIVECNGIRIIEFIRSLPG
jgi:hypothetical protein